MQEIMWPEEKRINHPVRKYRQLGDRFTWTIPVDSKKVEWSKTPNYVLEYASFGTVSNHEYLGLDERYIDYQHLPEQHAGPRCYGIDAVLFAGRTLKYTSTPRSRLQIGVFSWGTGRPVDAAGAAEARTFEEAPQIMIN